MRSTLRRLFMELCRRNWQITRNKEEGTHVERQVLHLNSKITNHAWTHTHTTDFKTRHTIDKGGNPITKSTALIYGAQQHEATFPTIFSHVNNSTANNKHIVEMNA